MVVRRSGGFAGLTKEGAVDLESDDPRVPAVRSLVDRIDFTSVEPGRPQPDRFVYRFRYATVECQVQEQALTSCRSLETEPARGDRAGGVSVSPCAPGPRSWRGRGR